MKVVITGSAGFVGSHLSKECVKQGHDVLGIDNLATGRIENAQININQCEFKGIL